MSQTETCECGQRVHATCSVCGVTPLHNGEYYAARGTARAEYDEPDSDSLTAGEDELDLVCKECEKKVATFIQSLR